ncbi:cobalamin biosynthesis protein CbiG [Geodermatophilus sp. TF02-6]|uniref:cobalamin biosynthesis protein n=1 Tax=Geodermatophilus sp. TF02-6 TaxID=2250575 RepID=UPI000DEA6C5F|nr:cobalamin biosynthesis protein [Geodermatophilus sp. TF02-6]RBY78336.1 cobalamin biosynthesis protein CbiG [Geodermatophilus sp. TF02-6]
MTVVGVGARPGVSAAEVLAAVDAVLAALEATTPRTGRPSTAGPPSSAGDDRAGVRLATLDVRAAEPGVVAAAAARGWTLTGHPVEALAAVPVAAPSARVAAAVGTPSVAEAAALLGGGQLLVGRTVVGRVTVAVAG